MFLDLHQVTVLAQLRFVKESNRLAQLRETNELFTVETMRISEDTAAIDDSDSLVITE